MASPKKPAAKPKPQPEAKQAELPKGPYDSWDKILAALAADLPEEAVERTKGGETGKGYDTTGYKYQYVINRFNDVLGLDGWGYTYRELDKVEYQTSKGKPRVAVTVETVIVLDPKIKDKELGKTTRVLVGGHDSNNYADALKGAITNSLKKTAAMFGNGKAAYEVTIDDDNTPEGNDRGAAPGQTTARRSTRPAGGPPASEKQIGMINALLSKGGWDREKFKQKHGLSSMKDLTVGQASEFIDKIQAALEKKSKEAPDEPVIDAGPGEDEQQMSEEDAADLIDEDKTA